MSRRKKSQKEKETDRRSARFTWKRSDVKVKKHRQQKSR